MSNNIDEPLTDEEALRVQAEFQERLFALIQKAGAREIEITNGLANNERTALMADVATELTDERDLMEDAARLTESDDKVNSVLGAGPLVRPSTMTVRDLAAVRIAILTILDDGCNCESGEKHPWEFYEGADGLRMRFADAVEKYLVEQVKEHT